MPLLLEGHICFLVQGESNPPEGVGEPCRFPEVEVLKPHGFKERKRRVLAKRIPLGGTKALKRTPLVEFFLVQDKKRRGCETSPFLGGGVSATVDLTDLVTISLEEGKVLILLAVREARFRRASEALRRGFQGLSNRRPSGRWCIHLELHRAANRIAIGIAPWL